MVRNIHLSHEYFVKVFSTHVCRDIQTTCILSEAIPLTPGNKKLVTNAGFLIS